MKSITRSLVAALAAVTCLDTAVAQSSTPTKLTDADTGIVFDAWSVPESATKGGLTFGMALPENALTVDATEFVGYLQCSIRDAQSTGYCGISLGGPMTNTILLMAWPYKDQILTSFRYGTGYSEPGVYDGDAKLTQISSSVTDTHYTLLFRCQNCLKKSATSQGSLVLGWAQAFTPPGNAGCPDQITMVQHDNGQSIWGAQLGADAGSPSYAAWAALATRTPTAECGGGPVTTTVASVPVPTGKTYDYVVVGGGAAGIPLADRLSESGKKSVLLIEKGPPSSGRWGGTMKPQWLEGTNLTRFDVPGLCNQIWVDSAGIACTDTDQMAGCVLGGGAAVNAGLWWKPYTLDWDYDFPSGWKAADMAPATKRVFSRIPGTDTPSADGKIYQQEGFNVLADGLKSGGWKSVKANDQPNAKNRTYAHTPYMFEHGERGGPMATYLVSAAGRKNFELWTDTAARRVAREGGHATGVEVEAFRDGGRAGTVRLTPVTGRVVLSAGAFGSAKILMRSGIGPRDQLEVVKGSKDGATMVGEEAWIDLPVGYNLIDHTNTDTVVEHPDVVFYDFYEAWTDPIKSDKDHYLNGRTGILTQSAPNIGPMFWDEIKGSDGIVRQIQWTARVEGSAGVPNGKAMTMSQYLGRGTTSRGRMTITPSLDTVVSTVPYLRDPHDKEAVIQGIKNVQAALKKVKGLTWAVPDANTTVEDFVNNMIVSYSNRRANHWMGTAKLGWDDGRNDNGTAVVDLDTRVYGTDNLFVVDASLFPGIMTTNPTSYIVIAAERASERMLALKENKAAAKFQQCGGRNYVGGPFVCEAGLECKAWNEYYSQCV